MTFASLLSKILIMLRKKLNLIFFHLIFVSFVHVGNLRAEGPTVPAPLKNQITQEILKSTATLKKNSPPISEKERNKLEDPELSQYIKDFCPRRNYLYLKAKWDEGLKIHNERMEIVKKKGAEAAKWRTLNVGKNSFVPLSSAPFEGQGSQPVSPPSLSNLKTFLDQRLREIYPFCDFEMTRQPQQVSNKIIQERKIYLKDLALVSPEQVLDSEMIELKIFDPVQTARRLETHVVVIAHGYKIRFQAPGKNILRRPIRLAFLVKLLKSGYYLVDMQELSANPRVVLPGSEIQRPKMDAYSM